MTSHRVAWPAEIAALLAATALLVAPALVNGMPFANSDTISYLRVGEGAWNAALSRLGVDASPAVTSSTDAAGTAAPEGDVKLGSTYLGARAILYGLPAYVLTQLGGYLAIAIAQALMLAIAARLFAGGLAPNKPARTGLALSALLTVATPAAFIASSLMPDVFLIVGALAIATLLILHRPAPAIWIVAIGLIALSVSVHGSHALIFAAAGAIGWALRVRLAPDGAGRAGLAIAASIVAAVGLNIALNAAAGAAAGVPLRSPPFLMARVVADGPGQAYLRHVCPQRALAMCDYLDRPLDDSQIILWDPDPSRGVFSAADYDTRVRLIEEQSAVVFGALTYDPLGLAAASARNVATLLVRTRVAADLDWNMLSDLVAKLERWQTGAAAQYAESLAVRNRLPFAAIDAWFALTSIAAALGAVFVLVRHRRSIAPDHVITAAVFLIAFLANLVICGVISGPFDRYQARALPLLVLSAGVLVYAWRTEHRRRFDQLPDGPERQAAR